MKAALTAATIAENSGLKNQMWGTIVDRDGVVCAVAFTGNNRTGQWPGSISAQKANTANAFRLDSGSLSNGKGLAAGPAANLYWAVQLGGSLFGLEESNPVSPRVAYAGTPDRNGAANDPMVGFKIGGVNVFGGGLALYGPGQVVVGGLGVSGDTSCTDRGVSGDTQRPDNIIYEIVTNAAARAKATAAFGHPTCINTGDQTKLPAVKP